MTLTEEHESLPNVEEEGIASTDTDTLQVILSGWQPVLMQESFIVDPLTPMLNVVHQTLAQGLEALNDVLVAENSRNDRFERVKAKRDRFLKKDCVQDEQEET